MKATQYNDTLRQALAYAEADRSDPFTFNRVMSHIANGVCDDATTTNGRMSEARYKADRVRERRLLPNDGRSESEREYFVDVFHNMQRP